MNAQVIMGKTMITIRGADHLHVVGALVEIQRSSPTGFETVAVAGDDLLVTMEPFECARIEPREPDEVALNGLRWHPIGQPLD